MAKKNPTRSLITDLIGGNPKLVKDTQHGLKEISLNKIAPYLNLDEIIVFASQSYDQRKKNYHAFSEIIEDTDSFYEIFNYLNQLGFPLLNQSKKISEKNDELYQQTNPFGKNLEKRLGLVKSETLQNLKKRLLLPAKYHVFECNYRNEKLKRDCDSSKIILMDHQKYSKPNQKRIVLDHIIDINKRIRNYNDSISLEQIQEELYELDKKNSNQLSLF